VKRPRATSRPFLVGFLLAALLGLAPVAPVAAAAPSAPAVQFTAEPTGLVSGRLEVAVTGGEGVESLELFVNGVRKTAAPSRQLTATLDVGLYIRRLRVRAVGYDAAGERVGEDEMVVNDPRPPFRVQLQGPARWPAAGPVTLAANVSRPPEVRIEGVDFFVGEEKVATDVAEPWGVEVDAARFPATAYVSAVAHAGEREAHDLLFLGDAPQASTEVNLQQIPLSVVSGPGPLTAEMLTVQENGQPRPVEGLLPAADQPLHVILLIDCSESMFEELPVVQAAARQFARELLQPGDRLAVVGFNQRTWWLTPGFTADQGQIAAAIGRVRTGGPTHLYDSVVEMLYEIQKTPGRHALVVLTDGADQGSRFELDHVAHYARYAGVPIYPVIKNRSLSRWMKLGIGHVQARRIANLAEDTGATYAIVEREDQLAAVWQKVAGELREQYHLVFHSEADVPDRWRALQVVSTAGHRLRAPRGYFP
jgi:VWFA-related protein